MCHARLSASLETGAGPAERAKNGTDNNAMPVTERRDSLDEVMHDPKQEHRHNSSDQPADSNADQNESDNGKHDTGNAERALEVPEERVL
jgi:hypothetical protein